MLELIKNDGKVLFKYGDYDTRPYDDEKRLVDRLKKLEIGELYDMHLMGEHHPTFYKIDFIKKRDYINCYLVSLLETGVKKYLGKLSFSSKCIELE